MRSRGGPRRAIVGIALVLAACARNPVSGLPELVLVSQEEERAVGREEAREVEETVGLVRDPALVEYVTAIGRRLARHAPGGVEYAFYVPDMAEPNAFALPGGHVYVSRGLLALVNDEDELAGVIGHEMGHVAARHAVRRVSVAAPLNVATGLGALATGLLFPRLGQAVASLGGLAGDFVLAPYSRGQEREADRLGQQYAAAAGWDPRGLTRMLATLQREEALHADAGRTFGFFATHPATADRVGETATHASRVTRAEPDPIAPDRAAFLQRLDGLVVGASAAEGVIVASRFLHPDLDFAVDFPPGWELRNERTAVGALAPEDRALVFVELAGPGDDPLAAAQAFETERKLRFERPPEPVALGSLPAAKACLHARDATFDLIWIAHAGGIFCVTGLAPAREAPAFQDAFTAVARSFRPLTDADRAEIREDHLRGVPAGGGETLAGLVARVGGTWSPAETAVANALEAGTPLDAGQLVKVPVREPYRPPS